MPEALAAIRAAGITLRPYRCDRCFQYHLTSRTKGKRVVGFPSRHPREGGDPA